MTYLFNYFTCLKFKVSIYCFSPYVQKIETGIHNIWHGQQLLIAHFQKIMNEMNHCINIKRLFYIIQDQLQNSLIKIHQVSESVKKKKNHPCDCLTSYQMKLYCKEGRGLLTGWSVTHSQALLCWDLRLNRKYKVHLYIFSQCIQT